jgi:hypothetical protein
MPIAITHPCSKAAQTAIVLVGLPIRSSYASMLYFHRVRSNQNCEISSLVNRNSNLVCRLIQNTLENYFTFTAYAKKCFLRLVIYKQRCSNYLNRQPQRRNSCMSVFRQTAKGNNYYTTIRPSALHSAGDIAFCLTSKRHTSFLSKIKFRQ